MKEASQLSSFRGSSFCASTECVGVAPGPNGSILVTDLKDKNGPVLSFTRAEWQAFIAGVYNHEFDSAEPPPRNQPQ